LADTIDQATQQRRRYGGGNRKHARPRPVNWCNSELAWFSVAAVTRRSMRVLG
jgi:hypothetical protein